MPLELDELKDCLDYSEVYPEIPIFYQHEIADEFVVIVGKVSWRGVLDTKGTEGLLAWLRDRGAIKVKGFKEIYELFA